MLLDAANKRYVRAKRSAGPGRVDSNKDGKADDPDKLEKEGHRGLQELRDFCTGMGGPEDGGAGAGGGGGMGGRTGMPETGLDRWGDPGAAGGAADGTGWGAELDGGRGVHFGDALLDDYVDEGGDGFGAGGDLLQAEADSFFAAGAPDQAGMAPPAAGGMPRSDSALQVRNVLALLPAPSFCFPISISI